MTSTIRNRLNPLLLLPVLLAILLVVSPGCYATGRHIIDAIDDHAEAFESIATADLDKFLDRVGDARFVLLGESTHGTQEFYEMRARLSQALIEQKGFDIIALEADWPDVTRIERYIQSDSRPPLYRRKPFSAFPRWMWLNQPFVEFTGWLKDINQQRDDDDRVHINGLDLYNLAGSMRLVLDYLASIEPASAEYARQQYGCLLPVADKPAKYGDYANTGRYPVCKKPVETVYRMFLDKAEQWSLIDRARYFQALQNALLVVKGEYFYRVKFSHDPDSEREAWNYREQNLLESVQHLVEHYGESSKVIIWAHNTHIGDSRATDMAEDDRHSLGERIRKVFPKHSYLVGFGTDRGTVRAAPGWKKSAQIMQVPSSHADSFEHLLHTAKADNFLFPLRNIEHQALRERFSEEYGQRAIGILYDPKNELEKHYIGARLAEQFDELIWFDRTSALQDINRVNKR